MRMGKKVLCLLGAIVIVTAPATVRGDSAAPVQGVFSEILDPNASGTKLDGPLTIYYPIISPGTPCGDFDFVVNMFFTLRLAKGNDLFAFGGEMTTAPDGEALCYFGHLEEQVQHIANFVQCTVVPAIFGNQGPVACPGTSALPVALKSVTDLTQDGQPLAATNSFYASMEITIAVTE